MKQTPIDTQFSLHNTRVGTVRAFDIGQAIDNSRLTVADAITQTQKLWNARRFDDVVEVTGALLQRDPHNTAVCRLRAMSLAETGTPTDGLSVLKDLYVSKPNFSTFSILAEYSSARGYHMEVGAALDDVYGQIVTGRCDHVFAILGLFRLLRQRRETDRYSAVIHGAAPHLAKHHLILDEFAIALHTPEFMDTSTPELQSALVRLAAEQRLNDTEALASILVRRSAAFQGPLDRRYKAVKDQIGALIEANSTQIEDTKNAVVARLFFCPDSVRKDGALLSHINAMTLQDLRYVFGFDNRQAMSLAKILKQSFLANVPVILNDRVGLFLSKLNAVYPDPVFETVMVGAIKEVSERSAKMSSSNIQLILSQRRSMIGRLGDTFNKTAVEQVLKEHRIFSRGQDRPAKVNLPKGRKLRVAVCLSGQLRGYDKAWPSVRDGLLHDVDYDLYLHAWEKIGRKEPMPAQASRVFSGNFLHAYRNVVNGMGYSAARLRYANLIKTDASGTVSVDDLAVFYDMPTDQIILENDESPAFSTYTNSEKMYYKVQACHKFMQSFERDYDLVIRLRPDKSFNQRLPTFDWRELCEQISDRTIFADFGMALNPNTGLVIGDQFGMSSESCMTIYANSLADTSALAPLNWVDWPSSARPHTNFAHALWINEINVKSLPVLWGDLKDPTVLAPETILSLLKNALDGVRRIDADAILLNAVEADILEKL